MEAFFFIEKCLIASLLAEEIKTVTFPSFSSLLTTQPTLYLLQMSTYHCFFCDIFGQGSSSV